MKSYKGFQMWSIVNIAIPYSKSLKQFRSTILDFICDALRHFVPFVQFQKRETHPWNSIACSSTAPWSFFKLFKLYKWYQIAQGITYFTGNADGNDHGFIEYREI